jgi:hypothetical protein
LRTRSVLGISIPAMISGMACLRFFGFLFRPALPDAQDFVRLGRAVPLGYGHELPWPGTALRHRSPGSRHAAHRRCGSHLEPAARRRTGRRVEASPPRRPSASAPGLTDRMEAEPATTPVADRRCPRGLPRPGSRSAQRAANQRSVAPRRPARPRLLVERRCRPGRTGSTTRSWRGYAVHGWSSPTASKTVSTSPVSSRST